MPKKQSKIPKKLTANQKQMACVTKLNAWFKHYTNEGCSTTFLQKTESARRAGYRAKNDDCLRMIGCKNFHKVSDKLEKWFDDVGLSENALRIKLLSLVEAKETKFFQHEGRVTDQREVEAIETQRRTLDMAIKVRGMYAAEKRELTGKDGKPLVVQVVKFSDVEKQYKK